MANHIFVTGIDGAELYGPLELILVDAKPDAIAIASAFVSVQGVRQIRQILAKKPPIIHLVAGTAYCVTHPEALKMAQESGWSVRLGEGNLGVFHPKLMVSGHTFDKRGAIKQPSFAYIGSANLTDGGLKRNVESHVFVNDATTVLEAAAAFWLLWKKSKRLDDKALRDYATVFASVNSKRRPHELDSLGISDSFSVSDDVSETLGKHEPPAQGAISSEYASEVWAGLTSFTGAYTFQVEFPKTSGEILERFIKGHSSADNKVEVYCEDDGIRAMTFRYYKDNGMYRLNVPNGVSGVAQARRYRMGIALVKRGPEGGPPITLTIIPPGDKMDEVRRRSVALGTWSKTSTRIYGWY